MKESSVRVRNKIIKFLYKNILKKIYFKLDPEDVHDRMTNMGNTLGKYSFTRFITHTLFDYSNPMLEQDILGIHFKNPVGLAAGFDKNAKLLDIIPNVGFGFEEVGSVTGEPCEGNPKPRLWRLKKSEGLVVYYGLMNDGAEAISKRLLNKKFNMPVGISVAKTNNQETCETDIGIKDYAKAFNAFTDIADYITVNLSCPNAFGGQPFETGEKLDLLLEELSKINYSKPVFIKFSPDLKENMLDELLEVAKKYDFIKGFVCTNLAKDRTNPITKSKLLEENIPENGGFSGKIVQEQSDEMIKKIYEKTQGKYIIIGVGGIFSAEDAYRKIKNGASLVQLITGMIFEGPELISDINQGLVKLLQQDSYKNISEAVGKNITL